MRSNAILHSPDGYRRPVTARPTLTCPPLVPSQDVSRYQATNMPPPTYELDRRPAPASLLTILVVSLALAATGGGIVLIQHIGMWLVP